MMQIRDHKLVMDDGTEYSAHLDDLIDPPAMSFAPLRHQVEIAEYMMRAWSEFRWSLSDEIISRAAAKE